MAPIDAALLEQMRQEADPVADAVVADIYTHAEVGSVNRMLSNIFRSDEPVPSGLPSAAAQYFADTSALPHWADPAQIAAGQRLFTRAGWSIGGALFCSSLPQAYASARGARVLTQTQGMTRHVNQRVFETAQFLFDSVDEGALAPGGRGVRTAQRVRLMHAGVRHLLLTRPPPSWDASYFGVPINQQDLAGTLMTFSVVTLEAMKLLGEDVASGDAEAWIHTWNVVGALLGIHPDLLPGSVLEAHQLKAAIEGNQWAPSEDGRSLVHQLIQMMQGYLPSAAWGLPVAMIRHLAGARCAEVLGLPASKWQLVIDAGVAVLSPVENRIGAQLQRRFFAPFTHWLMNGLVDAEREGKQARFRIPSSLRRTINPRS